MSVRITVTRDARGNLSGAIDPPGRLSREQAAVLGACKATVYDLLRAPNEAEREMASGAQRRLDTGREPMGHPGPLGTLAYALGFQDWVRKGRGEASVGNDVCCARALAFVRRHVEDGEQA